MNHKNHAIILAAGKGTRMGEKFNKVYMPLNGKPILAHTLEAFYSVSSIDSIILVISTGDEELLKEKILKAYPPGKSFKTVAGGATRQDSVYNGLAALPKDTDIVAIHDGARPLVTPKTIESSIKTAKHYGGAVAGMPAKDTIKTLGSDNRVAKTLDRQGLWIAQTPQTFRYSLIMEGHRKAQETGFIATDDSGLVEEIGGNVHMIEGGYYNLKITTQEDIAIAQGILDLGGHTG